MSHTRCGQCDNCRYLRAAQKLCQTQGVTPVAANAIITFWNHAVSKPCLLPAQSSPMFMRSAENDYLECIHEENGNYQNKCFCGCTYYGPKRSITCKRCNRNQTAVSIKCLLQAIYCGLMHGGTAYTLDSCLEDLRDEIKAGYYCAVFTVFEDSLQQQQVTFSAFNQNVAKNINELMYLLADLGVKPPSLPSLE